MPGARYRYSNIGYWLLGAIIEHASGQPFTTYVGEQIFRRLGAGRRADREQTAGPPTGAEHVNIPILRRV